MMIQVNYFDIVIIIIIILFYEIYYYILQHMRVVHVQFDIHICMYVLTCIGGIY